MKNAASRIDRYWSRFFGIEPRDLQRPGIIVVEHHDLANYPGAWFFLRGKTKLISVPEGMVGEVKARANYLPTETFLTEATAREIFGDEVVTTIGPAYQGYVEAAGFRKVNSDAVMLSDELLPGLERLKRESDPKEWEVSAIDEESESTFLVREQDRVVAAAGYEMWANGVCGVGVITAADCRGRGFGKAAVSGAVADAISEGLLVRYQTLIANAPSVRIAQSLGFTEYARTLAVRFTSVH